MLNEQEQDKLKLELKLLKQISSLKASGLIIPPIIGKVKEQQKINETLNRKHDTISTNIDDNISIDYLLSIGFNKKFNIHTYPLNNTNSVSLDITIDQKVHVYFNVYSEDTGKDIELWLPNITTNKQVSALIKLLTGKETDK